MAGRDKVSAARRRAEEHNSGSGVGTIRLPDGWSYFDFKPGVHLIDVLPYTVKRGKEHLGGNPFAPTGILYFERTFYVWRDIGPEEKSYVALGKTFGKPDPIAEWKQRELKNPNADQNYLKALNQKERQIFMIRNQKAEAGRQKQILEASNFCFGKLLDSRVQNSSEEDGWDLFYFADTDGMTLRVTIEEIDGGGFTFNKATAIDFIPRKAPLPDEFANHGIDLDALLVEVPYERMRELFLGAPASPPAGGQSSTGTGGTGSPSSTPPANEMPQLAESPKKEEPPFDSKPAATTPTTTAAPATSGVTATSLGITKGGLVIHEGKEWTVFKIWSDDVMLTLMDANDDTKKTEVRLVQPKPKAEERPKAVLKTATELGITVGMGVKYNGLKHDVARIKPDGTELLLITPDGTPVTAVLCTAVSPWVDPPAPKVEATPHAEPAGAAAPDASANDENWDANWR